MSNFLIRKSCFETNSSSNHSLCLKNEKYSKEEILNSFNNKEFYDLIISTIHCFEDDEQTFVGFGEKIKHLIEIYFGFKITNEALNSISLHSEFKTDFSEKAFFDSLLTDNKYLNLKSAVFDILKENQIVKQKDFDKFELIKRIDFSEKLKEDLAEEFSVWDNKLFNLLEDKDKLKELLTNKTEISFGYNIF